MIITFSSQVYWLSTKLCWVKSSGDFAGNEVPWLEVEMSHEFNIFVPLVSKVAALDLNSIWHVCLTHKEKAGHLRQYKHSRSIPNSKYHQINYFSFYFWLFESLDSLLNDWLAECWYSWWLDRELLKLHTRLGLAHVYCIGKNRCGFSPPVYTLCFVLPLHSTTFLVLCHPSTFLKIAPYCFPTQIPCSLPL